MKKTAAVIVTFNRCDMLRRCIDAVLNQSADCQLFIIDNNSSDGTGEYVASLNNGRIFYHNPGENIGGAGGFNLGLKLAMEQNCTHFWMMDDDCLPRPDALAQLLEADRLLDGKYGFLVSKVLWTDGSDCKMNVPKFVKKTSVSPELLRSGLEPVKQATFVSFFLSADTIRCFGLPQKEFFIWGDDIEYSRRVAVRGKIPGFQVGRSIVVHAMKDNTGSDISRDDPCRFSRYKLAYRNENCLYRREGAGGFFYYCCRCVFHLLKVIFCAGGEKPERLKIIVSSFWQGFFFNPDIEYPDK